MSTPETLQQSTKRIHWIDICRGLGILLVLYGHLFMSDSNNYLIFAFHMPLFFFISGLVFKPVHTKPLTTILIKYIKQLLIPYYLFAVLTYLFALISQTAGDVSLSGIAYQLFGILYGNGNDGMLGYNVVLWFLPCLFITKFTFAVVTKKIKERKLLLTVLSGSALLGALLSFYFPWIKLPFSFEVALTGITFYGAGYLLRQYRQTFAFFMQQKKLLAVATFLFMTVLATLNYHTTGMKVDLRINRLDNIILFYLAAFSGIISWVALSQILKRNVFLEYIGRHSMVLFAWHNVLFTDLKNAVNTFVTRDFLNTVNFFMPTLYVGTAISIILFCRTLVIKLKGTYHFASVMWR